MRIIGGQWRRSRLSVPDLPGLRPTSDRVRETLFNWLAHQAGGDLTDWHCLDAFAGTGALGLEAASRGAAPVRMVEQNAQAMRHLQQTIDKLGAQAVQLQRGDGLQALRAAPAASLDLVFLDPPFDAPLFEPALAAAAQAVRPGGLIYLEAPQAWGDEAVAAWGLTLLRHLKAGQVHAHLLRRAD